MVLDLGTFVFFNVLGFLFFFICLTLRNTLAGIFAIISMIVFFGLALISLTGPTVIQTPTIYELTYNSTGSLMTNSTTLSHNQEIISDDYGIILNAVYLGLGSFNLIIFIQKKWAVFGGS